jgi:hypothetical protein
MVVNCLKVKIYLKGDREGEFHRAERTLERNEARFKDAFEDFLKLWLEIDFERPPSVFQRAIADIAKKHLEKDELGFELVMQPKPSTCPYLYRAQALKLLMEEEERLCEQIKAETDPNEQTVLKIALDALQKTESYLRLK